MKAYMYRELCLDKCQWRSAADMNGIQPDSHPYSKTVCSASSQPEPRMPCPGAAEKGWPAFRQTNEWPQRRLQRSSRAAREHEKSDKRP